MKKQKARREGEQGQSKYAEKVERRKRLAHKLGVPVAPLPVLKLIERGEAVVVEDKTAPEEVEDE